jgi:hypothetical protein
MALLVGLAVVWLVVAAWVGVLVGRVVRRRDKQVPPEPGSSGAVPGP